VFKKSQLKYISKPSSDSINLILSEFIQPGCQTHQTLIIEEFEPGKKVSLFAFTPFAAELTNNQSSLPFLQDVFRQMIEYIHTGNVTLQPRTLLGVMNAADYYGLEELKRACNGFIQSCINVNILFSY
jgi:hypothetical protein